MRTIAVIFFWFHWCALAQNERLLTAYDDKIGEENSWLAQGKIWTDDQGNYDGRSPFFPSDDFVTASVTLNQMEFPNVLVKYHVFADRILIMPWGTHSKLVLELSPLRVSSFTIGESYFLYMKWPTGAKTKEGYFEVLGSIEGITFYKKHLKRPNRKITNNITYYIYKDKKVLYYVKEGLPIELKGKADLKGLFHDGPLRSRMEAHLADREMDLETIIRALLHGKE